MAELTPMMRQYMEEKEKHPDSLLFFRLGDFYEMFGPDARTASRELDLALTTRDKDKSKSDEERIPMCGVPYHSAEGYIARLIAKGYKVSICEQMEDPALAKGLVKREIIRTVTPGTVLDEACLEAGRSNYLCGVYLTDTAAGLCAADISTGQAQVTAFTGAQRLTGLINELGRFAPAEAVMNAAAYDDPALTAALEERFSCRRERLAEGRFDVSDAEKKVRLQFGEAALRDLPRNESAPLLALGGLLTYLYETQKTDVKQLDKLEWYRTGQFMELDLTARRNLELTETLRGKEKKGSLLWVLDKTKTPMGARNLRMWLQQPLVNVAAIDRRLNAVAALTDNTVGRQELRLALTGMGDMERLMSRIVYGTAGAVIIGVPIGFLTAVYLAKMAPKPVKRFMEQAVSMLAGIPSVVYGLVGMMVLVPGLRKLFHIPDGSSLFAAIIVLAVMILPSIIKMSITALEAVPKEYEDASLALGATPEETYFRVSVPAAKSGIAAAVVLGVGRAIGEAMAVMMVAGNVPNMPTSLFQSVRFLTTAVASEMSYSSGLQKQALFSIALVLFLFIMLINAALNFFLKGDKSK